MKKIITILLIIASIFSYLILYNNETTSQYNNMVNAKFQYSTYRILIPSEVTNQAQEDVYKKIAEVATKYKANIYYDRLGNGTNELVYTYFTNDNYFKNFTISKGREPKVSENGTEKFLSTEDTGEANQIGKIDRFSSDISFQIKTLRSMLKDKQLFNGYCYVQFISTPNISAFAKDLSSALNVKVQSPVSPKINFPDSYLTYIIVMIFYFIIVLLILYDLLKSYKKIGVQKMQGYSTKKIWISSVLSLIGKQGLIFILVTFVLSLIKFKEFNHLQWLFLLKVLEINVLIICASFFIYSLPFIYVNKITVASMIKNKQPIKLITVFNIIIKIALMVAFVIVANTFFQNFNRMEKSFTHSYGEWNNTKDYAIIPSYENIGGNVMYTVSEEYIGKAKQIYEYFNKKGAILADFSEFHPNIRELNLKTDASPWFTDWVNINPNYLKKQPIYDDMGKLVAISEDEKAYTVLIPEKYHSQEEAIRKRIELVKKGYPQEEGIPAQEIKIIWIKSNQKIFSYDMDVNPNDGNSVMNAFVRVVTEANAAKYDYLRVALCSGNPFKIKVDDPSNPSATIMPKLTELKLDIYKPVISSVYDVVGSEIKQTQDLEKQLAIEIAITVVFIVIIILQNIYNFFQVNKQRLVVQQFHGYKKFDKYKDYFAIVFFSWVIVFNLVMMMKNINIFELKTYTASIEPLNIFILAVIFSLVEIGVSFIMLSFVEKRKVINIIKRS